MDPEEFRKQVKKWAIIGSFFALALLFYALGWRGWLTAYVLIIGLLSVAAVLIQSGRGGGLAASLGGMGGDSLFGARSATPIARATYVMLGLFIFNCMLIAKLPVARSEGLMAPPAAEQALPAAPAEELPPLPELKLPDATEAGAPEQDD
jgi:protein translocase SecG subunit